MNRSATFLCFIALCGWAPNVVAQTKQDAKPAVDAAMLTALCENGEASKSGCKKCPTALKDGKGPLLAGAVRELTHKGTKLHAIELTGCSETPSTAFFLPQDSKPVLLGTVSGVCRAAGETVICGRAPNARRLVVDMKAKTVSFAPSKDSFGDASGFGALKLNGGHTGVTERGIGLANVGTAGRGIRKPKSENSGHEHNAPVPKVVPGKVKVEGPLDRELIRRVVRQHRRELKYCYESELHKQPKLKGRVVVRFTISATGTVVSSTIAESDLNSKSVENCLAGKIRRWVFPEPKGGGIVIVQHPFHLSY